MYSDKEKLQLYNALNNNDFKINTDEFYMPLGIFVILVALIFYNSFKNSTYTCNNFLGNIYLYVFTSLILFHILTLYFVKNKSIKYMQGLISSIGPIGFILLFIFALTGLFYLFNIYQTDIITSHLLLLLLISIFSYLFSYIFMLLRINNLYSKVVNTLILGLVLLALIFYFKKDYIISNLNDNHYLLLLYVVLFVIIVHLIFYSIYGYNKKHRIIYSFIIIVIFIYILLLDTKQLLMITKNNCKKALNICNKDITNPSCNLSNYPSYPQKSFNIFHDLIILLQETANIYLASGN